MSRSEFRWLARELRPGARAQRRSLLLVAAGWLLRHLPEVAAVLLVVSAWSAMADRIGPQWTVVVWVGVAVALVGWRRSRWWLLAALGCLLTRYRLRAALVELRLTTRRGRLPVLLGLVPTAVGERVWLWCRVGISAEDIADEAEHLRAACYARDVRVVRDRRWSALVTLDVIRRDRLSAATIIRAPLAATVRPAGNGQRRHRFGGRRG